MANAMRVLLAVCLLAATLSISSAQNMGGGGVNNPAAAPTSGPGSGTVTSVSVTTANGVSGTVATATTTPAITVTLGAITPSSAAIGAGSAITSSGPGGALAAGAYAGFGTTAGTVAQGNDSRITGAAQITTGSWTPVPTGLTVVGTPTYTGTYTQIGNATSGYIYTCYLTIASTTSTASTAGTTHFSGLPGTPANGGIVTVGAPAASPPAFGFTGVVSSANVFTPTWTAAASVIVIITYQSAT